MAMVMMMAMLLLPMEIATAPLEAKLGGQECRGEQGVGWRDLQRTLAMRCDAIDGGSDAGSADGEGVGRRQPRATAG